VRRFRAGQRNFSHCGTPENASSLTGGQVGSPLSGLLQTEMVYLGASLAWPQIVLNCAAAAVKATPLCGRLEVEP
jgi:hypothetical protein